MSETKESRCFERDLKQEEPKKKGVQPKSLISKKTAVIVNSVFVVSLLIFCVFSVFQNKNSSNSLQSHHYTNPVGHYEYPDFIRQEGEKFDFKSETIYKRDSDSSNSSSSKKDKATKPLDEPVIRFLLVLAGFIVLNMVAICIHHLFLKATKSEKSYRTIEQNISPF